MGREMYPNGPFCEAKLRKAARVAGSKEKEYRFGEIEIPASRVRKNFTSPKPLLRQKLLFSKRFWHLSKALVRKKRALTFRDFPVSLPIRLSGAELQLKMGRMEQQPGGKMNHQSSPVLSFCR